MTRTLAFAERNRRELLRDPLTLGFGLGFPLILLWLLSAIGRRVPVPIFAVESLAPGVACFGLSFIALFSAMLMARDRSRALMARLCASPMTSRDFILGYALPLLPMAVAQCALCYLAALPLGLRLDFRALGSLAALIPAAILYVALGLLCGALLDERQAGGICGALLTNVGVWLSGAWFDLDLLGDGFRTVAEALPFANAVAAARAALQGDLAQAGRPLIVLSAYAVALTALAVTVFSRRMRRGIR